MKLRVPDFKFQFFLRARFATGFGATLLALLGASALFFLHYTGDQVLKEVGQHLRANIRESDTDARMGGDEFTVILNHLKKVEDVSFVVEKIIEAINQPTELDGTICNIGASIGIVIYPDHAECIKDLIIVADSVMCQAKADGKNKCRAWNEGSSTLVEKNKLV